MCNYVEIYIKCATILKFIITVGMEGMRLLNPDLDKRHRAALLRDKKIDPLVTRTQKQNWRIHLDWVQRYVFYLILKHVY